MNENECKGCQDRDRMITLLAERIDELAKEVNELRQQNAVMRLTDPWRGWDDNEAPIL